MAVIKNVSETGAKKNYIVARNVDGAWWFWGAWDTHDDAVSAAQEVGGQVFPNTNGECECEVVKRPW